MNARQYDIVKGFLLMGNTPQRIAKEFKAKLSEVQLVAGTYSFTQFKEKQAGRGRDFMNDIMNGMGI